MTAKLYKGLFWIKQDEQGRFIPITVKVECDADGNAVEDRIAPDKDSLNHEEEWKIFEALPSGEYRGMKYDHYPRGRVEIKNKKANIYLPSVLCIEYVKRLITNEFGLWNIDVSFVAENQNYDYIAEFIIPKCTMCEKPLNEWDMQEDLYFKRRIGYGSKYDLHIFEARLCCDYFDSVLDKILPMFKESPLT